MWIARRVYQDLLAAHREMVTRQEGEIAFLRAQLAQRQDHTQRLERVAAGRPETAPPPPPAQKPVEVPDEFWDILGQFDNPTTSAMIHREALEAVRKGVPWRKILDSYRALLPKAEEEAAQS